MKHSTTQKLSTTQPAASRALPQAALPASTAAMAVRWSRASPPKEVWDVVHVIVAWPSLAIVPDRSGLCLSFRGVTLGHLSWNSRVDVQFGPEVRARLVAEGLVRRDPDEAGTDRVGFVLRTEADVDHAVWLLKLAYRSVDLKVGAGATETER